MGILEYETAVEDGVGREEAWSSFVQPAGEACPPASQTWLSNVGPLEDPVECYRSHALDQLLAPLANGDFASCGRCRRTYVVDPAVMQYAAGFYLSCGRIHPVVVHPGRKALAVSDSALDGAQEHGLIHPWRIGPWTLDGVPSQ
jgi:hypothetical protein